MEFQYFSFALGVIIGFVSFALFELIYTFVILNQRKIDELEKEKGKFKE